MKLFLIALSLVGVSLAQPPRWTEKAANEWYAKEPWLVGSNYLPATAINQLEMWGAEPLDPAWVDTELTRAELLGMNTLRVFLHDLPWKADEGAFEHRIDRFLAMCDRHHIKPILVLFDSCWDPYPLMGTQHDPRPGIHNSGWVQSPGAAALMDPTQYDRLRRYVQGLIGNYRYDKRILAWDLWNEPDNTNNGSYAKLEPVNKKQLVLALLPKVFEWARAVDPLQPLTSGVWQGDWSAPINSARSRKSSSNKATSSRFTTTMPPRNLKNASSGCKSGSGRFCAPSTWRVPEGAPSRTFCPSPRSTKWLPSIGDS
jgi:hypothetical protein